MGEDNGPAGAFARLSENIAYSDQYITVSEDQVIRSDGASRPYVRIRYKDSLSGIAVIPEATDGSVYLHLIRRNPFQETRLEFPRGNCGAGESTVVAARREFLEETSLHAQRLQHLGWLRPDTGIMEIEVEVFLASVSRADKDKVTIQKSEGIQEYRWMSTADVWRAMASGEIRDGFTLGAMALLHAARGNSPGT